MEFHAFESSFFEARGTPNIHLRPTDRFLRVAVWQIRTIEFAFT